MIARDLLSKGADINAVCQHPDIGKAFWVAAVFEEFIGEESVRAELCLFFLDHGFDPTIGKVLNGTHALTYLISYSCPNYELFFLQIRGGEKATSRLPLNEFVLGFDSRNLNAISIFHFL